MKKFGIMVIVILFLLPVAGWGEGWIVKEKNRCKQAWLEYYYVHDNGPHAMPDCPDPFEYFISLKPIDLIRPVKQPCPWRTKLVPWDRKRKWLSEGWEPIQILRPSNFLDLRGSLILLKKRTCDDPD